MADTVYLTASPESNKEKGPVIWEYVESVAVGVTGNWIILPDQAGKVSVWLASLIPSGGTAKIQVTGSLRNTIINGTPQEYDWGYGSVNVATNDAFENISAIRVIGLTGSATIEVRVS